MHKVGEFEISRVVESEVPFIEANVFLPDFTPDALEANRDWLCPATPMRRRGKLIFAFQSYVVRSPRHTILVDTCVGNDKPRPNRPSWHMQKWPYLADLGRAGVTARAGRLRHVHAPAHRPRRVEHPAEDGRWVPTFPNAKYIFARTEYEFWEERDRSGTQGPVPNVFDDSVRPVMEAGQVELVGMDYEFDKGLWFEPAPGHTVGNMVIHLKSGGARAVLSGDVLHHPLQLVRPEWSSRACEDKAMSATTRRALIERYADTDTLIAPAHFASPSIGRIVSPRGAFAYRLAGEA